MLNTLRRRRRFSGTLDHLIGSDRVGSGSCFSRFCEIATFLVCRRRKHRTRSVGAAERPRDRVVRRRLARTPAVHFLPSRGSSKDATALRAAATFVHKNQPIRTSGSESFCSSLCLLHFPLNVTHCCSGRRSSKLIHFRLCCFFPAKLPFA